MKPLRYEIRIPDDRRASGKLLANGGRPVGNSPLRTMRRQAYLTQEQVAQRLGVSQRRVSEIERSDIETLQLSTLRRYINAVGGDMHIIIGMD